MGSEVPSSPSSFEKQTKAKTRPESKNFQLTQFQLSPSSTPFHTKPELKTEAPPIDLGDLKRKSVRGSVVTMASQGANVAIQLVSTVVLARLLSPDDYGVMAMVLAITAFAGLFRDLGLSAAAIQKKDLTHAQQSNLFWLNVGMGAVLTGMLAAAAPAVAWFYGKSELVPLTLLLSCTFLIGSLGTQHGALMLRNLQFGRRAIATIGGALAGLIVAIVLALGGHGYWSLAWGNVIGAVVTTFLLFLLSSFRPGTWSRGVGVRKMLSFGAHITGFDLVNYFNRNLDSILIGRFWGADALGLYSRAYQLLMFPISNLRGPITAVAFPALSRLQSHPDEFRKYYIKVTSLIALLSMPLTAFLFIASTPVVVLALGKAWLGVAPIFSWLALAAFIQPTSGFAGSLLLSLGQGVRYLQCGIFNTIILIICFFIGVQWGALGMAIAYAIGNYIILYPWLLWAFRRSPVVISDFFKACLFPAGASVLAAVVTMWGRVYMRMDSPVFEIAGLGVLFFCIFITLLATPWGKVHRQLLQSICLPFLTKFHMQRGGKP